MYGLPLFKPEIAYFPYTNFPKLKENTNSQYIYALDEGRCLQLNVEMMGVMEHGSGW